MAVCQVRWGGDLVGFAYSRDERRVPLRVRQVHSVKGAPNDLLSVSAMLQQGYSFHFTKEKSWILTPEMETLDLIEKGGLFWLKWQKAMDPSTQHADYEKYCAEAAKSAEIPLAEGGGAAVVSGEPDDAERVKSESFLNSFSAQGLQVGDQVDDKACCAPSCHRVRFLLNLFMSVWVTSIWRCLRRCPTRALLM